MNLFDREPLFDWLAARGQAKWAAAIKQLCDERIQPERNGNLRRWIAAWNALPEIADATLNASGNAVRLATGTQVDSNLLSETLMAFHPWRKGPFEIFGLPIDTEWRSDWKWDRIASHVEFRNRSVLDIGCGNGYYGWRMLNAGAAMVLGCDPYLLYLMQFEILRKYTEASQSHFVVPLGDRDLPAELNFFDIVFSMGVLYHQSGPIEHLLRIWSALRPGGQFVLETLIIDNAVDAVLMPDDRYAKMKNVWFIPSTSMLLKWMRRSGFVDSVVVDVTVTTTTEQRRTPWMTFESLADFLDPQDPTRTLEGYPAPRRVVIIGRRPK